MRPVLLSLLISLSLFGYDAAAIIKKVEDNLNGKSAVMEFSMTITTKRGDRTMKMKSWAVGTKKSFIKISYPKKDRGITFLKLDTNMWQYVPKIEKTIKIPSSMMGQSWMGSDFTNDDMVKEDSISKDYRAKLLEENDKEYVLELIPTEDAAVVWGKIIFKVSKKYILPKEAIYYDEDGVATRVIYYKDVRKKRDRFYPHRWEIVPLTEEKKGRKTIVEVLSAEFDTEISSSYFTKRALKRYSR